MITINIEDPAHIDHYRLVESELVDRSREDKSTHAMQWAGIMQLLLHRELISHSELLYAEIEVTPLSGRNENLMVSVNKQGRFIVRHHSPDPDVLLPSAEAALLRFIRNSVLSTHGVPNCLYSSDAEKCIVVEYIRDSENMRLYWAGHQRLPKYHCKKLGQLLAKIHYAEIPGHYLSNWHPRRPAILKLREPHAVQYLDSSPGILQTIHILQQSKGLQQAFTRLHQDWKPTHLCHNDIRSENILLTRSAVNAAVTGLVLIDWELAGVGDPAWDIASVFSEYATYWIDTIPTASQFPSSQFSHWASFNIEHIQQMTIGFWNQYQQDAQISLNKESLDNLLYRALNFVPVRLVQSAVERCQQKNAVDLSTGTILQLAENLVYQPTIAEEIFFGARKAP